jgi:beta-phosphoglucomutase-like phosphatase (HAD superfamily)
MLLRSISANDGTAAGKRGRFVSCSLRTGVATSQTIVKPSPYAFLLAAGRPSAVPGVCLVFEETHLGILPETAPE